jgi:hypothetical protein
MNLQINYELLFILIIINIFVLYVSKNINILLKIPKINEKFKCFN